MFQVGWNKYQVSNCVTEAPLQHQWHITVPAVASKITPTAPSINLYWLHSILIRFSDACMFLSYLNWRHFAVKCSYWEQQKRTCVCVRTTVHPRCSMYRFYKRFVLSPMSMPNIFFQMFIVAPHRKCGTITRIGKREEKKNNWMEISDCMLNPNYLLIVDFFMHFVLLFLPYFMMLCVVLPFFVFILARSFVPSFDHHREHVHF